MTFGTSSRVQLRAKPEATFGAVSGAGNHYALRLTGESLKYAITTTQSNEIRSDRQVTDLIQTGGGASGGVQFEWSYGEYDDLLQGVLFGTWGNKADTTGEATITATFAATTITAASGTPFTNIVAGQWVRVSGAVNAQNNGWFKVVTPTSSTVLTFAAATFTAEGPTASVKVQASRLKNGTTQRSFTLERNNADLTQFTTFAGMTPSSLSLSIKPGAVLTGSIEFMGKDATRTGTTALPGTTTASLTNAVYNGVSNVVNILEGGSAITTTAITAFDLSVNNNLRGQQAIGTLGYVGIGSGVSSITGSISMYFADGTYYDKFLASSASSLSLRIENGSKGIGYVLTLPNIKYTDGSYPTPGINQDILVTLPFQALRDTSLDAQIIIDRGGDAVTAWA
jgi:hypothetical protein